MAILLHFDRKSCQTNPHHFNRPAVCLSFTQVLKNPPSKNIILNEWLDATPSPWVDPRYATALLCPGCARNSLSLHVEAHFVHIRCGAIHTPSHTDILCASLKPMIQHGLPGCGWCCEIATSWRYKSRGIVQGVIQWMCWTSQTTSVAYNHNTKNLHPKPLYMANFRVSVI